MSGTFVEKRAIPGYEMLRRVGEGGMGDVFLANQLSLDRQVVIKIMKVKSPAEREELTRRFDREAALMAEVTHPNIVAIFDRGTVDDRPICRRSTCVAWWRVQRVWPAVCFPVFSCPPDP